MINDKKYRDAYHLRFCWREIINFAYCVTLSTHAYKWLRLAPQMFVQSHMQHCTTLVLHRSTGPAAFKTVSEGDLARNYRMKFTVNSLYTMGVTESFLTLAPTDPKCMMHQANVDLDGSPRSLTNPCKNRTSRPAGKQPCRLWAGGGGLCSHEG